tara:strand:+ start:135 stop:386 length:252 start_codon:yes stop_codon:yes gene_type:complete
MMAVQVIYNRRRIKDEYPDHFEVILKVKNLTHKNLSKLYNDPSMTKERFMESVRNHYYDISEEDNLYFYTNEFRPALIANDDF